MTSDSVRVALADIFPSNTTMSDMMAQLNCKNREQWWHWMWKEYGASRDGLTTSKRFGYGDTAVLFSSREEYVRYCLQWL